MIKLIKAKEIKYIGIIIIIILFIFKFFNTPYNFYSILNWNYEERMEQNYGFCKNESWGFYNLIIKKYDLYKKDITIINDEGYATLEHLFDLNKNNNDNNKFVIILNYTSKNNENILSGKYDFLRNYKIRFRQNNCYLLEKND